MGTANNAISPKKGTADYNRQKEVAVGNLYQKLLVVFPSITEAQERMKQHIGTYNANALSLEQIHEALNLLEDEQQ